jgi:hypothetical protein
MLGSFSTTQKITEVFSCASKAMCVPPQALQLVLENGKAISCTDPSAFLPIASIASGSEMHLSALLQIPMHIVDCLESVVFDTRRSAYMKLAQIGDTLRANPSSSAGSSSAKCDRSLRFTSATVCLLKRVLSLIQDGLDHNENWVIREAVLEALSEVSRCFVKIFDCGAAVEDTLKGIAKTFGNLTHSALWTERQKACAELGLLKSAGALEITRLCECCSDANLSVKVEAYRALAMLLESNVQPQVPSRHLDRASHVLGAGLKASQASPIGEWACRGLGCLAIRARCYVGALRSCLDRGADFVTRRAANHALDQISKACTEFND